MKTDPSAMLRLGSVGAHIILGLVVGTQVLFAGLSVASYKEPWMVALALIIYAPGAVLLSRPHPDPFPLRWTVLVLVIGVATNALVEWNLPDSGWPGYASWNFGAVTWLSFFLAFRGRIGAGWLGLALMAAVTFVWAASVGRGPLDAVDLVIRHAGTLLMATLFSILLTRTSARITALHQQQRTQVTNEAASNAEIGERALQAAQLNGEARRALELIAAGGPNDEEDRQHYRHVEASLRDGLRGGALATPTITSAARRARVRGVEVLLLDDSGGSLAADDRHAIEDLLERELDEATDGAVTARLLPVGREAIATVVANSTRGRKRVDYGRLLHDDG